MFKHIYAQGITLIWLFTMMPVLAQDIDGVVEHPMFKRYPGQVIAWQHIENYQPYKVAIGGVAGYRAIKDWIETEGRVTRTFYKYQGEDRSYSEVYKNFLEALKADGFEILGEGMSANRKGVGIGSRQWMEVTFRANPTNKRGEVGTMFSGTSSSGGAGAIVAKKERAAGTVYVVVYVEQHAKDYIGTLIDIVEVEAPETGLVIVDGEAMGASLAEYGRVVLDGIVFDFDKATIKPESKEALAVIAQYLQSNASKNFYVVGHTDAKGSFNYNHKLSTERASAVVEALKKDYGIKASRLQAHGIGPLSPVFSNGSDAGQDKNRRVELVEQ
ncbi:MAG: OmpA family protein [Cognaticolwellia sp.]